MTMSGDLHQEPEGATPLTLDERQGLIPSNISLRHELNEVEQQNIAKAMLYADERKHNPIAVPFAKGLHKRMFGDVWKWAGQYRQSEKNIGCMPWLIEPQLYDLVANAQTWVEFNSFPPDEIAVRFHHELVKIHPFANGNGRWSRLMGDILARRLDRPAFTWGSASLVDAGENRTTYIAALKVADGYNIGPLLALARA